MKVKTSICKAAFAILVVCTLILATLPSAAVAQNLNIISGSPGDTISFTGTGTPDSKVRLEVSTVVNIGTYLSPGKYNYKSDTMKNVKIPDGNSMSITVSPVDTLTVSGSIVGTGRSTDGLISGNVGTFSVDASPGTYDIVVSGIANGTPSSISMTIRTSRFQSVSRDGTYTVSINTSGMPASVYTVTQDGNIVAMVYLGVKAPATPTPSHVPSPCSGPGLNGTNTTHAAPTASPQFDLNSDSSIWALYILLMVFGSIIGIAAAYLLVLFVFKKH